MSLAPEMRKFAAEINQFLANSGAKAGTRKAKELEAALMVGYIYGALAANPAAQNPLLHMLLLSGRQLTDEAKQSN